MIQLRFLFYFLHVHLGMRYVVKKTHKKTSRTPVLVYYSGSINKQYYLYELLTAFLHTNSETHVMMYTFPKLEKPLCIIFLYSRYRQYNSVSVV